MTTANPPAPSAPPAQVLFFPRLYPMQPRHRTGRIATWPFRVVRERGPGDSSSSSSDKDDIRVQAARVVRTTAEHWWPSQP